MTRFLIFMLGFAPVMVLIVIPGVVAILLNNVAIAYVGIVPAMFSPHIMSIAFNFYVRRGWLHW